MFDVIVIGGGPSGLHAADCLGKKGLRVLVLEKKEEIGKHVICTGVVSQKTFEEFKLSKDSVLAEINTINWISPFASSLTFKHDSAFAYVVNREKFDKSILKNGRISSVSIMLKSEVLDITKTESDISVTILKESKHRIKITASVVILATGINYKLHRKLNLGYPKDFLCGIQAEFKNNHIEHTQICVGNNIAPGAFAWIVPLGNGIVRVGLMTEKDPLIYFDKLLKNISGPQGKFQYESQIQFKAIAQGLVSKTYGERIISLGEAAGQVKTTTGGGIYFGLLCAEIAANVVYQSFEKENFTADLFSQYEKLWKKAIKREILIGYYMRKLCSKFNDFQIEQMFQKAQNDGVIPLIKKKGDFDWHSETILPMICKIPFWEVLKNCHKIRRVQSRAF